ncbi:MAG: class I SAM-dependent methyltransferase, partial [Chlamydiales bacterium]|nr:class I SAM-dependent methyltransferase [Chlamydiales bacterium]
MNQLQTYHSKPIEKCQICHSRQLGSLLFLGFIPPVNEMLEIKEKPNVEIRFPLELLRCETCGLVQIGYEVDPKILFPHSYPYLSGTTRILRDNFLELSQQVKSLFPFKSSDLVVDIGANDGTLLRSFKEAGYRVLGIEPSQAADVALQNGISMIKGYFSLDVSKSVVLEHGLASFVTAANVFAHIKDPHEVIEAIISMLAPEGIFISESHYLLDLIETLQYDTVYHEHLRYYSLESLIQLFKHHDLEVIRVKRIPTHGGSIRVFSARKGEYPIEESVSKCLVEEKQKGLSNGTIFSSFKQRVIQSKLNLLTLLQKIKGEEHRIYGIGAPTRGSTLINYVGLDDGLIDAVMEVSSSNKLNRFM